MRYATLVGALILAVGLTVRAQPGAPATRTLRGGVEPAPRAAAAVTFTKDVAPILHAKCITCHRPGEVAPMALRTYDEVRPWARAIKQKVVAREMPPWFADPAHGTFANDARLSQTADRHHRAVGRYRRRARQAGRRATVALVH